MIIFSEYIGHINIHGFFFCLYKLYMRVIYVWYIYNALIISLNRNRIVFFMIAKTCLSYPGIEVLQFDTIG